MTRARRAHAILHRAARDHADRPCYSARDVYDTGMTVGRRIARVLLALWAMTATSSPAWRHVCPMHDHAAAATTHGTSAHEHRPCHDPHPGTDPGGPTHDDCCCLGACAATTALHLPASRIAAVPVQLVAPASDPRHARGRTNTPLVRTADRSLPYPNGPPRSAA